MTINAWSENTPVVDEITPQIVSGMFLRLIPFVVFFVVAGVVAASLAITRDIRLPQVSVYQAPEQPASGFTQADQATLPEQNPVGPALSPVFTDEVLFWKNDILGWAERWGLDPNLIATIMQIESCGYAQATSSAGAAGLFQVMPFHFQDDEQPYDPQTNALRGMAHLIKSLRAHSGEVGLAFAGYNAGIAGSMQPRSNWANETRRYVYWATGIYQDALSGATESNRLQEWLDAGGRSLCRQASRYQQEANTSQ